MNTTTEFKRLAAKRFRQINPEVSDAVISWNFTSDGFVPDRIGSGATMHGSFVARASGFKSRLVTATMVQGAKDVTLR